jgi:hypothetical protein
MFSNGELATESEVDAVLEAWLGTRARFSELRP